MDNIDPYLQPGATYNRLYKEYKEHGGLVIAVDFDDTLFDFHKKGYEYPNVIELVQRLKGLGCYIIIWTGNEDKKFVKEYCDSIGIKFNTINKNPPFYKKKSRKIYYNALIDDRAGIFQVYSDLRKLCIKIEEEEIQAIL